MKMQKKYHREILQIPSKDNNHTAVCQVQIANDEWSFSDFAVAQPSDTDGSTDTKTLLVSACNQALNSISKMPFEHEKAIPSSNVLSLPSTGFQQRPVPLELPPATSYQQSNDGQQYKHSHNKPMSESQGKFVQKLASGRGKTLEDVAQEILNKSADNLSSHDADTLIKKLQEPSLFYRRADETGR